MPRKSRSSGQAKTKKPKPPKPPPCPERAEPIPDPGRRDLVRLTETLSKAIIDRDRRIAVLTQKIADLQRQLAERRN